MVELGLDETEPHNLQHPPLLQTFSGPLVCGQQLSPVPHSAWLEQMRLVAAQLDAHWLTAPLPQQV